MELGLGRSEWALARVEASERAVDLRRPMMSGTLSLHGDLPLLDSLQAPVGPWKLKANMAV